MLKKDLQAIKLYHIHVSQRRDGTYPRIRVKYGFTSHEDISLVI